MSKRTAENEVTLSFDSYSEMIEHFDWLRLRLMPVPGVFRRWSGVTWSDDGRRGLMFASSTGVPNEAGTYRAHFVEMYPSQ